ncbi:unnamed protein product [Meganyctiphanes norvegica]|uniref:Uncharacterized protein n=1 Tax=Meganyctiphanes norvegica TaxID=48144 RepID=A0AAV2SDN7_MEGNR
MAYIQVVTIPERSCKPTIESKPLCLATIKGTKDLKHLLNYLFTRSPADRLEAKIALIDSLRSKEEVNTDNINTIATKFLKWYEVTAAELVDICCRDGIFKETLEQCSSEGEPRLFPTCFCGFRVLDKTSLDNNSQYIIRDKVIQYRFHQKCEFVCWFAQIYGLKIKEDTVINTKV